MVAQVMHPGAILKNAFFHKHFKRKSVVIYRLPSALFRSSSKNKKNPPQENVLYFGKMELSNSGIKQSLMLSQKKAFLIFQETKTPKNLFLYFGKRKT